MKAVILAGGLYRGVRGAAVDRDHGAARAFARMDDVAARACGFKDEPEVSAPGCFLEEVARAVRASFFVRREEDFPADLRGVGRGFKGLKRGEQRDQPAFHVGDAGAVERAGVEPTAGLERVGRFVNGIVVTAEEDLKRRGGTAAKAQRDDAGRIVARSVGRKLMLAQRSRSAPSSGVRVVSAAMEGGRDEAIMRCGRNMEVGRTSARQRMFKSRETASSAWISA